MPTSELTRLEALWEELGRVFPGRVRALHLLGSQLDGTATPESDLDLVLLLRGEASEGDRAALRELRAFRVHAPGSGESPAPPLDILPLGDPDLEQGVPAYARASRRVLGEDVLGQARLMPLGEVVTRWSRGAQRLLAHLLKSSPEELGMHFDLTTGAFRAPDPAAPHLGLDLGECTPAGYPMSRVVATLARMVGAWLARDGYAHPLGKHDCMVRATQLLPGPRSEQAWELYRSLKLDAAYRWPRDRVPLLRDRLRDFLDFAGWFFREFPVEEEDSPGPSALGGRPPPPPGALLGQRILGGWLTQALATFAELGLADALGGASRSPEDLAAKLDLHAGTLARLLRALVAPGVLERSPEGLYRLGPLGSRLRSDHPESQRSLARMAGMESHRRAWSGLLDAVRSGRPAFREVHGRSFFEYLAGDPGSAAIFDGAMSEISRSDGASLLGAWDFSGSQQVMDVGGGQGRLLAQVLEAYPDLVGTLVDLPSVLLPGKLDPGLPPRGERLRVAPGSFFDPLPPGADTLLLKHVLHDWSDPGAERILHRCRQALAPGGRLLVLEGVLPEDGRGGPGALLDLEMLVMTEGGRERTEEEFRCLLERGGFRLTENRATATGLRVLVAEVG